MENKSERLIEIRLSIQRALLGMIYPEIRSIAIGLPKPDKLKVIMYLDREPNEFDYDNIKEVTGEVLADVPELNEFEELCIFTQENRNLLDGLDWVVYARKE